MSLIVLTFFPTYNTSLVVMFMLGFGYVGRGICGYVWMSGFLDEKGLMVASGVVFFIDGLVLAFASIYFEFICKNWIYIIVTSLVGTGIVMVVILFFVEESPKWLYDKGHIKETKDLLTSIGRINGVLSKDEYYNNQLSYQSNIQKNQKQQNENYVSEFFKNPSNIQNFLCMLALNCAIPFSFNIFSYYLKYIPGSIFVNAMSSSFADSFGYLLVVVVLRCISTPQRGF